MQGTTKDSDLLAGCKILANSEYLWQDITALVVIAVAWAKEHDLLNQNVKLYQEKWNRAHV